MGEPQHIGYILATTWAEFGIQLASFKIRDTTYTAKWLCFLYKQGRGWCGCVSTIIFRIAGISILDDPLHPESERPQSAPTKATL